MVQFQPKAGESLTNASDDEVVALTAIPGGGAWTVYVFLIFNLGRLDVMPTADLGIGAACNRRSALSQRPSRSANARKRGD